MKPSQIYLSDLILLRDVFASHKKDIAIFDPYHRLDGIYEYGFRLLREPLNTESENTFFIDLTPGKTSHYNSFYAGDISGAKVVKLFYINNPDGTIRWFFPADNKNAGHLSLYNSASWKSKLYKGISRIAWSVGQGKRLASGVFYLQQNLFDSVKVKNGVGQHETVSFFTGTRGATRKAVMEIHNGKQCKGFVKIPLTMYSDSLVKNEIEMLTSLGKYDFTTLSVPKLSNRINGNARISNIKPGVVIPVERIMSIHANAMAELYVVSHEKKMIMETAAWVTIMNNMEFLKQEVIFTNGLNADKTKRIIYLLKKLYNLISVSEEIPVSVAHGDFTPWNMYCDEQRLYVYDWELASNGIPMLFDLYHFTFQTTILQQRKEFSEIKKSIHDWQQTPLVKQIVQKYKINTDLHYRLYLLFNISYYLRQYIAEKELLIQSAWMIDAWLDALEETTHIAGNPA